MGDNKDSLFEGNKKLNLKKCVKRHQNHSETSSEIWKVLIVDDEGAIHKVTRLALDEFTFQGKGILFLDAYSAEEAKEILADNPNIAVILLDVVMETDDAGLKLVEYIREELGNYSVRIVLRTGQPGKAPERRVISSYAIDDYKTKTELTQDKLFTVILASMRTYDAMKSLESFRSNLEGEVSSRTTKLKELNKNLEDEIKERERLELRLREIRKAIETVQVGVTITNTHGKIIYTNPAEAQMHGYEVDELLGKHASILGSPDSKKKMEKAELEKAGNWKRESINLRRDGSTFPVQLISTRVKDSEGNLLGMVTVSEDISQRKKAEKAIRESERKLKELNATKDKFFSIIAHDLKGPLGIMVGFSDMLSEFWENLSEVEKKETVEGINVSSKKLFKLLENLLDWSRSQTGRIKYEPDMISLRYLIESTIILLMQNALEKDIELDAEVNEDINVFVDREMIATVIRNLVANAIKFTDSGGRIDILAEEKGDVVEVAVVDTGIGIRKEDMKKLFRIDVHHSTIGTSQEKGTGLGLILCREFVERHGGKIWAESEFGKGSTFKFTLPKQRAGDEVGKNDDRCS
jgi:PAS domain S-box-containing protein